MSLFQTSVVKKYLNDLSSELIDKKYKAFIEYFGNSEIQQNIRDSKEEEFQEGFIRELFVKILDYTLKPNVNFNIVLEKKNVDDSKKADGAILKDDNVIAVIELKSTQTTDLDTVETQAFGYKNHHPKCQYIITSNFEKIRIYIQNAIDNLELDLFNLSKEDFALLWLCFSKDNILNDIPLKIKEASVLQEENVTKQLYNDYSKFRKEIFANIVKNNPEFDKLVLFKKTQKLLDRFLFIFFAEDKLLLPPNSISEIVKQWITLKDDLDEYVPLYDRFKKYFGYLNTGFKGKKYDIFAYNGGLFLPDEILDNIKIDDEILHQNTLQLSTYDFETEVDVNILGHIFEHSLGEIENVQAEIAGEEVVKQKTKRKKDGIFYTPKYITKYIVENTVGKLCKEKREELGIIDEEYAKGRRNRKKDIVRDLDNKLTAYREWLLELTILDPACGSGAFLNQALEFLIHEHKKIDELKAQLLGGSIVFPDIEAKILEKNIYGVDLNEESVEIAKLSLWLRTAQKGRKLTILSNNIKCGNSLIDDPEIAGEKAFNWQNEFSEVFKKGGFDVVIGNPPYVSNWTLSDSNREMVEWLAKEYKDVLTGHWDLFICFISVSINYLKDGGYNSFILPTSFLKEKYGRLMREKIILNQVLLEIVDFGEEIIFENVARQTFIYNIKKHTNPSNKVKIKFGIDDKGNLIPQQFFKTLKNSTYKTNVSSEDIMIYDKLLVKSYKLGELFCVNVGVVAHSRAGSPIQFKKDDVIHNEPKEGFKKYIIGSNLSRYSLLFENQYMDYETKKEYFHRPKFNLLFESDKIVLRRTSGNNNSIIAYFDNESYYTNDSIMHLVRWSDKLLEYQKPEKKWTINVEMLINEKFILALLCSKLITYYFSKFLSTDTLQGAYSSIYPEDVREFPIIKTGQEEQLKLIKFSEKMQNLNTNFQKSASLFINYFGTKISPEKPSKKLQNWHELDFDKFITELNKAIKTVGGEKLSKMDEIEWIEVFEAKKTEVQHLKSEIAKTDKEIDQMVYELYGLTEEEIGIIESSVK